MLALRREPRPDVCCSVSAEWSTIPLEPPPPPELYELLWTLYEVYDCLVVDEDCCIDDIIFADCNPEYDEVCCDADDPAWLGIICWTCRSRLKSSTFLGVPPEVVVDLYSWNSWVPLGNCTVL